MHVRSLHSWDLSTLQARELQQRLRGLTSLEDAVAVEDVRVVAGVDNGYVHAASRTVACAVAVALSFPDLALLEAREATVPVEFPYVPGLLAFREVPAMLEALRQLTVEPDVVLVDAHGYAHPRRMGAASHLGLLLERPTIGCAKRKLVGDYDEPERQFGARRPLVHRGEVVGAVVRTRLTGGPLFVSPGHKISVDTAVALALACTRPNSRSIMPEPTRLADKLTKELTARLRGASAPATAP